MTIAPALTLQWILWLWSASTPAQLLQRLRLAAAVAVEALKQCGTGLLGVREYACEEHGSELIPNSCRRRDCPRCVGRRSFDWCGSMEKWMLPCSHFHVVFTLPGQITPYWRYNRREMVNVLFDAASNTLRRLLADRRYMGGVPAIFGVVHTHGSTLWPHLHVHMVVSAYGLDFGSGALASTMRPKSLLPFCVLRRKFQLEFSYRFKRFLRSVKFQRPKGVTDEQTSELVDDLFRRKARKWNVKVFLRKEVAPVIRYLSRSVYGGCIRNDRIKGVDDGFVTFSYTDWKEWEEGDPQAPTKLRRLPVEEFVSLWSEHVPEPGERRVRHFGLLAPGNHDRLEVARALLEMRRRPSERDPDRAVPDVAPPPEEPEADPAVRCRTCGAVMTYQELPPRSVELSVAARAAIERRSAICIRAGPFAERRAA